MTTLTSPHDLLAAVPFLVGYHPLNSLVVIALKEGAMGMAMRIDYPDDQDPNTAEQIDTLAEHLVREGADSALVVAYLPDATVDSEYLLDPLREAIEFRDIKLRECLTVQANRFRSVLCHDANCCPPEGTLMPVIEESRVAAEQVAIGKPLPFKSVVDLRESISAQPIDAELLKAIKKVKPIDYKAPRPVLLQRAGALALNGLTDEFARKGFSDDKKLIALVLVRLLDLQVRDYAMGITDSENIETLWSMWRWLLRIAPIGYIAPVAALFSAISYERGDGALATRALERAFADDANYPLAKLLRRVYAAGWPPESFANMRLELHPKICTALFSE